MIPAPPIVCLVTDRRRVARAARTTADELAALERLLDDAAAAGVDVIHVRERDLPPQDLTGLVRRVMDRVRGQRVQVLVNDRADVALASGADGVHLRHDAPPTGRVRGLHPSWTIGRSIHVGDEPGAPAHAGADFFVFGPVFATVSKPGAAAAGLQALAAMAARSPVPVVAIGGVDPARAAACVRHGAKGVAAIGLFLPAGAEPGALGPERAVRALREAMAAAGESVW